ncbi:MAG: ATP-binding protein, partial [Longimicrobiales bacterium]|nr:ATP-binding protein [Longimicrobiales bacterium]
MEKGFDFSTLPVVGREEIQEELLSTLQSAMDGRGRTILLKGERGTGKTHLCRFLKGEAERRGFTVVLGNSY